jgi:hypothetical protein
VIELFHSSSSRLAKRVLSRVFKVQKAIGISMRVVDLTQHGARIHQHRVVCKEKQRCVGTVIAVASVHDVLLHFAEKLRQQT